ncbi:MAG: PPOX class F420-dependent oxidoreductase [Proteobacteria bacterium]|nr:PPOX class F420-dependent oxidoreductase [Pseudomonadota bacterium]MDA1357224.1 PPOX class F420-dependent oxidoreductase [Pseudomonadota bacterium]
MELPELAKKLLAGKNFATIATLMPSGAPQASVIWVDVDGDTILFNTSEGRIKANNVRRDARVAIAVTNAENPYQQAMIQGHVTELIHDGADAHVDSLAKKYMGVDTYPFRQAGEQRVIIKIAADKVGLMDP